MLSCIRRSGSCENTMSLTLFLSFPPAFSEKVGGQRDSLFRFCEAKMYLWNKTVTRHSLKRKILDSLKY